MGLRYKKANVTHKELGVTVQLPIIGVKKNPQNPLYTQLGVLTRGTIIEVNVSELGLVTAGGKVVWGRWAQITSKSWVIPITAQLTGAKTIQRTMDASMLYSWYEREGPLYVFCRIACIWGPVFLGKVG
jgi:hypothetical protein